MKYYYRLSKMFKFSIVALFILIASSCSKKLSFNRSVVVPAADGRVKVKKDDNKNYTIDIKITHLARIEDLTPAAKTYIAWMETEQNSVKNIGQLKSSSGLFSSTLKASLNTVTSFKATKIFITAENDANISYPTGVQVLTTNSFN